MVVRLIVTTAYRALNESINRRTNEYIRSKPLQEDEGTAEQRNNSRRVDPAAQETKRE